MQWNRYYVFHIRWQVTIDVKYVLMGQHNIQTEGAGHDDEIIRIKGLQ